MSDDLLGPADAKARARVRLPDGREGTLTYCPPIDLPDWRRIEQAGGRYSSRAKVRLDSGRYLSVDPDQLARA